MTRFKSLRSFMFFVVLLAFAVCTVACATVAITPDTVRQDAGDLAYVAYRFAPPSRPFLDALQKIDVTLPEEEVWVQTKEQLAQVWTSLDLVATDQTVAAQILINRVVNRIGLQRGTDTFKSYLVAVVAGINDGTARAQKVLTAKGEKTAWLYDPGLPSLDPLLPGTNGPPPVPCAANGPSGVGAEMLFPRLLAARSFPFRLMC